MKDKATIDTMINGAALILIAAGTQQAVNKIGWGLLLIAVGVGLEYAKYYGRSKKLW